MKQRVLLCIMDGWGINKDGSKDAISAAKTPLNVSPAPVVSTTVTRSAGTTTLSALI